MFIIGEDLSQICDFPHTLYAGNTARGNHRVVFSFFEIDIDYTEEEIADYFQEARRLKDQEGLSYADIAEKFGVTKTATEQSSSPSATNFSQLIEEDVREEAFDAFRQAATNVMRQGYEQLPRFLLEARQALIQSGEAEEAIRKGVSSFGQVESNEELSPKRIEQLPSDEDDELSM